MTHNYKAALDFMSEWSPSHMHYNAIKSALELAIAQQEEGEDPAVYGYEVGTAEYPCLGFFERPKNLGQMATYIADHGDEFTHEGLCDLLANWINRGLIYPPQPAPKAGE